MTIAQSGQRPIFETSLSQARTRGLVWRGGWIILGVIVTIAMWMAFAGLCVTIIDDFSASAVGDAMRAPQQLAQIAKRN